MPTAINKAIVINKNTSNIYKFCVFQVDFYSLKFIWIVLFSFGSIIPSYIINDLSIMLSRYLPYKKHAAGFQI